MADNQNSLTTKEKILKVTLEIIATEGVQNITIRKIASQAGVNIAAVNYHFGCKDTVINEALKYVTQQIKDVYKLLQDTQSPPEERLRNFLTRITETVYLYPDIIKYSVMQNIFHEDLSIEVEYQQFLKDEGIDLVAGTLRELYGEAENVTYMRVVQLLSCVSFPLLIGGKVKETIGFDFFDPQQRAIYTELLIRNTLREASQCSARELKGSK